MRKFNVTVNGKAYAVEIEEVGEAGAVVAPVAAPAAVAAPVAAAPAAAPAAPAPAAAGKGEPVKSQMPGLVK